MGGGDAEEIGSAVVVGILSLGNGRCNKPTVTNPFASSISSDHLLVHLQCKLHRKEERRCGVHFANFCNAVPWTFMTWEMAFCIISEVAYWGAGSAI